MNKQRIPLKLVLAAISNYVDIVVRPIKQNPILGILIYVFLFLLDVLCKIKEGDSLLVALYGFFVCYILMIPLLFAKEISKLYRIALLSFSTFIFLINILCVIFYGRSIDGDIIGTVKATNISETFEYLTIYFRWEFVVTVVLFVVIIYIFYARLKDKRLILGLLGNGIFVVLILLSFICFVRDINIIRKLSVYKTMWIFTSGVPDLRNYRQKPVLSVNNNTPENVVMVIGESYAKSQSSLYGYEKLTNPKLGRLYSDGKLNVFQNVNCYAYLTIPSIKSIMAAYTDDSAVDWYRCLTLIDIMSQAGYTTCWISNQSKKGIADNEVGRYAELCDMEFFVGNKYAGLNRKNLDEEILPLLQTYLDNYGGKNFIVIQLMGSHHAFSLRYPKTYSVFKAVDYSETHKNLSYDNRQLLAEYDNSVLYNDSVVYEIIQCFANREAVLFYFPDHGIDAFKSSNDYIGHANSAKSQEYGRQIPFMVYTTEKFKEKYPQIEEKMWQAVDVPYRTDSIMYTIMDVAGIETVNGVSYKIKSLFK